MVTPNKEKMMARKLATVRTIAELKPIEGADLIELAIVDGWQCVVKKGEHSAGDKVVYFEVDSFIPATLPFMESFKERFSIFNGIEGLRVKTIKLRGQISQGIIISIQDLHRLPYHKFVDEDISLDEALGVIKYERPENQGGRFGINGSAKGDFPWWISKTDQERVQNMPWVLNSEEVFEVTIKLDGSSITVYNLEEGSKYSPDGNSVVGVCSRNVDLKEEEGGAFWSTAKELGVVDAIKGCGRDLAIQGELISPSIQGNFEGVSQPEIHIYDVYDITEQKYLKPTERLQLLSNLGLGHLAIKQLGVGSPATMFGGDLSKALDYAEGDGLYSGYREGVVFKSFDSDTSFKIISNQYLLKEK